MQLPEAHFIEPASKGRYNDFSRYDSQKACKINDFGLDITGCVFPQEGISMRTINIGGQQFDRIREKNYFYVDKTDFICEWWESGDDVTLITRPRRFGKTLNMSMLECFFSNKYAGRADLFEGLSVWESEKYRELQGTYPVIFLSFANIKERTYTAAAKAICRLLARVCGQYRFLLDSDKLEPYEREQFRGYCTSVSEDEAADVLNFLSEMLKRQFGKNVLIFLDEYDTPLQEAFVGGYWNEMAAFVRSLFNAAFKTNPSMERAIMTGITRVSKESIFSDLNNLKVVTMTSAEYAEAFGFTEEEVFAALDEFGLQDQRKNVKDWYDGFTFGEREDIYNPWSILNFLDTGEFAPYWANTSSNSLISYELRIADNGIKHQMEGLLNGGTVQTVVDEQIIFSQLGENAEAIWSLFLAGGYLRVRNRIFNGSEYEYTLALTNFEVRIMFRSLIRGWFSRVSDSYSEFTAALITGDTDLLNYYLNDILLNTASYFDTRKKTLPGHEMESFYHGLVLGLVATEQDYIVRSNRESGLGRYDVMMKPKNPDHKDKHLPAIIIEFKAFDPKKETTLDETADRALTQIREKKYDAELLAEGLRSEEIIHYGMVFRGKEALVKTGETPAA